MTAKYCAAIGEFATRTPKIAADSKDIPPADSDWKNAFIKFIITTTF